MWFDKEYYRQMDREDGHSGLSLHEQIKRERAEYEKREKARLARNERRERAQEKWPPLVCRWAVLADGLVSNCKLNIPMKGKNDD